MTDALCAHTQGPEFWCSEHTVFTLLLITWDISCVFSELLSISLEGKKKKQLSSISKRT